MLIFWGRREEERRLGSGAFFCPSCATHGTYSHYQVVRCFMLCFLPVRRTVLSEYLKCRRCRSRFAPGVLHISQDEVEALRQPWKCPQCENLNAASAPDRLACHTPRRQAPPQTTPVQKTPVTSQPRRAAVHPVPRSFGRRRSRSKFEY